ncbi:hypothetical protein HDU76_014035, partial [Blyttiomyces sp. JEL0837]
MLHSLSELARRQQVTLDMLSRSETDNRILKERVGRLGKEIEGLERVVAKSKVDVEDSRKKVKDSDVKCKGLEMELKKARKETMGIVMKLGGCCVDGVSSFLGVDGAGAVNGGHGGSGSSTPAMTPPGSPKSSLRGLASVGGQNGGRSGAGGSMMNLNTRASGLSGHKGLPCEKCWAKVRQHKAVQVSGPDATDEVESGADVGARLADSTMGAISAGTNRRSSVSSTRSSSTASVSASRSTSQSRTASPSNTKSPRLSTSGKLSSSTSSLQSSPVITPKRQSITSISASARPVPTSTSRSSSATRKPVTECPAPKPSASSTSITPKTTTSLLKSAQRHSFTSSSSTRSLPSSPPSEKSTSISTPRRESFTALPILDDLDNSLDQTQQMDSNVPPWELELIETLLEHQHRLLNSLLLPESLTGIIQPEDPTITPTRSDVDIESENNKVDRSTQSTQPTPIISNDPHNPFSNPVDSNINITTQSQQSQSQSLSTHLDPTDDLHYHLRERLETLAIRYRTLELERRQ